MKEWVSLTEVASVLGVNKSNALRALRKRDVKTRKSANGRGGPQRFYHVPSLPPRVRNALVEHWLREEKSREIVPYIYNKASGELVPAEFEGGGLRERTDSLAPAPPLSQEQITEARARFDLVELFDKHVGKRPRGGRTEAGKEFIRAYNTGDSLPQIYEIVGKTSYQTVMRWRKIIRRGGTFFDLADRRGEHRFGQLTLTEEQVGILLRFALHPNRLSRSEAIRWARLTMRHRGIPCPQSDATFYRFLNRFRQYYYDRWVFYREGIKGYNDKVAFYIERDYSQLEVGDILVADGHTLNFETLNPWTGKPKRMTLILWYDMASNFPLGWEVMPTENTQAIASALRRAILRLGKYPKVAYLDNGKAFGARFFNGVDLEQCGFSGLFHRLGIQTINAMPYHAQSKTVERFFRDFGEMERMIPSYTGTSIARKPPRLNRGEKLHRAIYEKVTGGRPLTLDETHAVIAWWFDQYADRPQKHSHLAGAKPGDVFAAGQGPGVDRNELNYLMMGEEHKTIYRNGIRFGGAFYYAPALHGRRHRVLIRYDLQDPSYLLVYETGGEFICEARPTQKVHPAAEYLGTESDKAQLKESMAMKRALERETTRSAREFLKTEILPAYNEQLRQIGVDRNGRPAGRKAVKTPPPPPQIDERELEATAAATDELRRAEEAFFNDPETLRYLELRAVEFRGEGLADPDDREFLRIFELGDDYRRYRDRIKEIEYEISRRVTDEILAERNAAVPGGITENEKENDAYAETRS